MIRLWIQLLLHIVMAAKKILLTSFLVCCCIQGSWGNSGRIVGGDLVQDSTKYPSQCSVRTLSTHECGCTILDEYHVISAASCVKKLLGSGLSLKVGTTHVNEGGQNYEVLNDPVLHPDYIEDDPSSPDIAILILKYPLVLTSSVQPVTLPAQDAPTPTGSIGTILGWGFTADVGPISATLKEATVTVMDLNNCAVIYSGVTAISDTKICTDSDGSTGYCDKDEGGPLYVNGELHGVIQGHRANSGPCAEAGKPDVFTRVASYVDWIIANSQPPAHL